MNTVDYIILALRGLGGSGTVTQILAEVQKVAGSNMSAEWQSLIPDIIASHSSDSASYHSSVPDLFYLMDSTIDRWGLRRYKTFGAVATIRDGAEYQSREELAGAGLHTPLQAAISGSENEGADSLVLFAGYDEIVDGGDVILYPGHGGREPKTGRRIGDQRLSAGNLALALNCIRGLPLRLIRSSTHTSPFSPRSGYRYDGLFTVDDYWKEKDSAGFASYRYRLVKIADPLGRDSLAPFYNGSSDMAVCRADVLQVVRETVQSRLIKELYEFGCQVCAVRLDTPAGPYAEAVHVKPLRSPHFGPDELNNLVCLCSNHSLLFRRGGFAIDDRLGLIGIEGRLHVKPTHALNPQYLSYHRECYFGGDPFLASDDPLPQCLKKIEAAINQRDGSLLESAANEMAGLLEEPALQKAAKAASVLKIMGRVGDLDNAPKIFHVLRDELQNRRPA